MQRLLLFRRDLAVIAVLIVIVAAAFAYFFLFMRNVGGEVEVTADGELVGTFPLDEDRVIELSHNTLVIKDGHAYMEDADCPDKLCIKQGRIHFDGQSIVCLPNRVVVVVRSKTTAEVDDVAR